MPTSSARWPCAVSRHPKCPVAFQPQFLRPADGIDGHPVRWHLVIPDGFRLPVHFLDEFRDAFSLFHGSMSPRSWLPPRRCSVHPHDPSAPRATVFVRGSEALTPLLGASLPRTKTSFPDRRRPVPRRTPVGGCGRGLGPSGLSGVGGAGGRGRGQGRTSRGGGAGAGGGAKLPLTPQADTDRRGGSRGTGRRSRKRGAGAGRPRGVAASPPGKAAGARCSEDRKPGAARGGGVSPGERAGAGVAERCEAARGAAGRSDRRSRGAIRRGRKVLCRGVTDGGIVSGRPLRGEANWGGFQGRTVSRASNPRPMTVLPWRPEQVSTLGREE